MLFPALLVLTTLLAQVQEGTTLVGEIRSIFEQFLPADTMDLLQSYVLTRRIYSGQLILSAIGLSIFAGLGMMLSLMEGFRRAYQLSSRGMGLWEAAAAGSAAGAHRAGAAFGGYAGDCLRPSD